MLVLGVVLILLVMEGLRRVTGWMLFSIVVCVHRSMGCSRIWCRRR